VLGYFTNKATYRAYVEEGMALRERPLEKGKGHGIVGDTAFITNVLKRAAITPGREQPGARIAMSLVEPERVLRAVMIHFNAAPQHVLTRQIPGSGEKYGDGTPLPPRGHDPERDRCDDGSRLQYGKCLRERGFGTCCQKTGRFKSTSVNSRIKI
jgi:hypothetical protein